MTETLIPPIEESRADSTAWTFGRGCSSTARSAMPWAADAT